MSVYSLVQTNLFIWATRNLIYKRPLLLDKTEIIKALNKQKLQMMVKIDSIAKFDVTMKATNNLLLNVTHSQTMWQKVRSKTFCVITFTLQLWLKKDYIVSI